MASKNITLAPGASQVVSFEVIPHEVGTYNVTVDGLSGSFRVTTAPVADIRVSNLEISPVKAYIGYPVQIIAIVTNYGSVVGGKTVDLLVPEDSTMNQTETIPYLVQGVSTDIVWTVYPKRVGTYHVQVDGVTSTFSAIELPLVTGYPLVSAFYNKYILNILDVNGVPFGSVEGPYGTLAHTLHITSLSEIVLHIRYDGPRDEGWDRLYFALWWIKTVDPYFHINYLNSTTPYGQPIKDTYIKLFYCWKHGSWAAGPYSFRCQWFLYNHYTGYYMPNTSSTSINQFVVKGVYCDRAGSAS